MTAGETPAARIGTSLREIHSTASSAHHLTISHRFERPFLLINDCAGDRLPLRQEASHGDSAGPKQTDPAIWRLRGGPR